MAWALALAATAPPQQGADESDQFLAEDERDYFSFIATTALMR